MNKYHIPKKIFLILLLPIGILLSYLAELSPQWIENIYSRKIFVTFNQYLSSLTGLFPFSIAEIIYVLSFGVIILLIINTSIKLVMRKKQLRKTAFNFLINILAAISIIYFAFNLFWGFNYYRLPFSEICRLEIEPASISELEALCLSLAQQANNLRADTAENHDGIMYLRNNCDNIFISAEEGYSNAASRYPELKGKYGRPKKIILSELMSYAGITGIYFPFTGEANINITAPHYLLPATICHEMAHQRGFAREDEANYIAYLTCMLNPNPDFQYSGTLLALTHSINALYRHEPERALLVHEIFSEGLKRDLADKRRFWQQYEGPLEHISSNINDTYLKANRQEDGINSYGRMVDLLLAQYRLTR